MLIENKNSKFIYNNDYILKKNIFFNNLSELDNNTVELETNYLLVTPS
jgi:hypothetical protein